MKPGIYRSLSKITAQFPTFIYREITVRRVGVTPITSLARFTCNAGVLKSLEKLSRSDTIVFKLSGSPRRIKGLTLDGLIAYS